MWFLAKFKSGVKPPHSKSFFSSLLVVSAGFRGMGHSLIVSSGFGDQIRGVQQTLKSPGIAPPSLQFVPGHVAAIDISVVNVRNFQFAAAGRFKSTDDVKDIRVVHVNSNHCIFRLGLRGLLLNLQHAIAVKFRDAETLRIRNTLKQDFGAATLLAITVGSLQDISLNDVVTKNDTDWFIRSEVLDQRQRRRD